MSVPVVQVTPAQVQPRQNVPITGLNFDRVAGVFLYDAVDQTYFEVAGFQIDDGQHLHFSLRPDTPLGQYSVVLVDLDDNDGTSTAPPLTVVAAVVPPVPSPPSSTVPGPLVARLRFELQDNAKTFQTIATGDGITTRYELDEHPIEPNTLVVVVRSDGTSPDDLGVVTNTTLVLGTDYTLDAQHGVITTVEPIDDLALMIVSGTSYRYFVDGELATFISTAFAQQSFGRLIIDHTVDPVTGFKRSTTSPFTYDALPEVEILPLIIAAKIQALWVLATDASTDIDISEDGASIPVSERYRQIMQQIAAETSRYGTLAEQLNIGLGAIEQFTLRRVSRQTGWLIPVYVEKEYDDHSPPIRVYPPINTGSLGGSSGVDPYFSQIGP